MFLGDQQPFPHRVEDWSEQRLWPHKRHLFPVPLPCSQICLLGVFLNCKTDSKWGMEVLIIYATNVYWVPALCQGLFKLLEQWWWTRSIIILTFIECLLCAGFHYVLYIYYHLILIITIWKRCSYYPCFTDRKTETRGLSGMPRVTWLAGGREESSPVIWLLSPCF